MRRRWFWLLAALLTTAVAGFAQYAGSDNDSEDSFGGSPPAIPRTVSVVGKVLLEDGVAPVEPVLVEAACNNIILPESYTDRNGRFSVEIGDASALMGGTARTSGAKPTSASFARYESDGRREATIDLRGCELRLELTGFQPRVVSLDGREASSYLDLGAFQLRRHAGVEGDSISVTTLQAPDKARKRYDQAVKQLRGKRARPDKATKELQTALEEYPTFAAAWALLGEIHWKSGDLDQAEGALGKALEADPAYLRPYLPLARIAYQKHRWDDTLQLSNRLLRLNPYLTDAVFLQALASFQLGQSDQAEKSAQQVRASNDAKRFPEVHYLLGMIRSKKGDFLAAATEFREYLKVRPGTDTALGVAKQLEQWSVLGVIPR